MNNKNKKSYRQESMGFLFWRRIGIKRENSLKDKTFKESLAETARFELAGDCSLTDFEPQAIFTAPPLSVPEIYNMSTHSARFCKSNDFLREICEIDARKHTKI